MESLLAILIVFCILGGIFYFNADEDAQKRLKMP